MSSQHVEIKFSEKIMIKVPLIGSNQCEWIIENIINNTKDYTQVYKRQDFQNSQDLLYNNLRERPDPFFK